MSTTEQSTHAASRRQVAPSKAEVAEARALAKEAGLEYVDLDRYPLNAAATSLLPHQASRRHHALAVGWKFGTPVIAVAHPDNVMVMDDLRTTVGRDVHAVVACESQIDAYIERMYNRTESAGATPHGRGLRPGTDGAAKAIPPHSEPAESSPSAAPLTASAPGTAAASRATGASTARHRPFHACS